MLMIVARVIGIEVLIVCVAIAAIDAGYAAIRGMAYVRPRRFEMVLITVGWVTMSAVMWHQVVRFWSWPQYYGSMFVLSPVAVTAIALAITWVTVAHIWRTFTRRPN